MEENALSALIMAAGGSPKKKLVIPKRNEIPSTTKNVVFKPSPPPPPALVFPALPPPIPFPSASTMIKTIFIREDWPENRRLIKKCIQETYKSNKGMRFIFPVDQAPEEDKAWLRTMGEVIELTEGKPPRMNLLLKKAIGMVNEEFVWTCEQDTNVQGSERLKAEELMKKLPDDAFALEMRATDENNNTVTPIRGRRSLGQNDFWWWGCNMSFSGTYWRMKALKLIEWEKCPPHRGCDSAVSRQLKEKGYVGGVVCKNVTYLHIAKCSYKEKSSSSNTLPSAFWKISGSFDFDNIYGEQVERLQDGAHIVEVGCYFGRSTCYMAELIKASGKKIKFDVIDIFTGSKSERGMLKVVAKFGGSIYNAFIQNMKEAGVLDYVNPIIGDSAKTAKRYADGSLDFVFIDADHTYESVKKDIEAWLPKIKSSGVLAGHDYQCKKHPGVAKAVDEKFKDIQIKGTSWIADRLICGHN